MSVLASSFFAAANHLAVARLPATQRCRVSFGGGGGRLLAVAGRRCSVFNYIPTSTQFYMDFLLAAS